jgi:hypothetical protein
MNPSLDLGLALLCAHLVGDFIAQTDAMAAAKKNPGVLATHAAIHGAVAYVLAGRWGAWPVPLWVFSMHGGIDFVKARTARKGAAVFLADQAAHIAVIAALAAAYGPDGFSRWVGFFGRIWPRTLLIVCGAIACVRVAAILIGFWVQPYLDEVQRNGSPSGAARGLTNGGRVIGQWERCLIFLLVLIGQPGAIGFLVAAKSIFRFGELTDRQNRMEAEYITIGTLMSFGIAVAIATATVYLARHL